MPSGIMPRLQPFTPSVEGRVSRPGQFVRADRPAAPPADCSAAVPEVSELVVGTGEHECYTPEYRALTRDFYLKF